VRAGLIALADAGDLINVWHKACLHKGLISNARELDNEAVANTRLVRSIPFAVRRLICRLERDVLVLGFRSN
jgi:hypothetical protein